MVGENWPEIRLLTSAATISQTRSKMKKVLHTASVSRFIIARVESGVTTSPGLAAPITGLPRGIAQCP